MPQITTSAHSAAELRAAASYLATLAAIAEERENAPGAAVGLAEMQQRQEPSIAELSAKLQADNAIKQADRPDVGAVTATPVDLDAAAALAAFGSVPTPLSAPAVPTPALATPIAPPAAAAPAAGVDKRGFSWDSRIHSTPAAHTAEGVWRKRRGVADELTASVEAAQLAARGAPAVVPAPPASVAVPLPPVVAAPVTVPTPIVPAPPAIASSPVAAPNTLAELMARCAKPLAEQRLGMAQIIEACKAAGLDGLAGLHTRSDLTPSVWAKLPQEVLA